MLIWKDCETVHLLPYEKLPAPPLRLITTLSSCLNTHNFWVNLQFPVSGSKHLPKFHLSHQPWVPGALKITPGRWRPQLSAWLARTYRPQVPTSLWDSFSEIICLWKTWFTSPEICLERSTRVPIFSSCKISTAAVTSSLMCRCCPRTNVVGAWRSWKHPWPWRRIWIKSLWICSSGFSQRRLPTLPLLGEAVAKEGDEAHQED